MGRILRILAPWFEGLLLLLLATAPLLAAWTSHPFWLDLATRLTILAIAAAALNLVLGIGGLVSFGHAAFLGIGAYAVGIPAWHALYGGAEWIASSNGFFHFALAAVAGALFALLTGPLALFGARAVGREGGRLPMTITGAADPVPVRYELPVPSAQVKSAVLLAGLNAPGETIVHEPEPCRDHTERMLKAFGADISEELTEKGRVIRLAGQKELKACDIEVPGDPSSAAFPLAAAILCPDSRVTVRNVLLNPTRTGLIETLHEMGAEIRILEPRQSGGEVIGHLRAETSSLRGVTVPAARAPSMIDEYPVLAVLAAFAHGTTRMEGLSELRVKESDRLQVTAEALAACGAEVKTGEDWMEVTGSGGRPLRGGAVIDAHHDHRIAMSFLVLGLAAEEPVTVRGAEMIATSFPGFVSLMRGLGADIAPAEEGAS